MMTDERSLKRVPILGVGWSFTRGARHDDRREVIETRPRGQVALNVRIRRTT